MGVSKTTAWHMYCTRDSPSEQTFMTLKKKKKPFVFHRRKKFEIFVCVYIQSRPKISAPLVNMIKESCEN